MTLGVACCFSLLRRGLFCAIFIGIPSESLYLARVACEQAFSRAGWGEGKAPFPPLSSLFFPKQRACSQAKREPLRRREVLFEPCLLRLLQRRKSRLEVRIRNKSVHPIIVGYLGAVYSSIVLGNHPVPVKLWKLRRIFLLRVFVEVLQNESSQTEDL